MKLPNCTRCNQPRTPDQLRRGICGACRVHTCTKHPEGRVTCYGDCRCRCNPCTRAWYKAEKARKRYAAQGVARRVDATGTVRRIRALWALGWDSERIATAAGIGSGKAVWQIAGNRRYVSIETAAMIDRAYGRMCMRLGPSSVPASRASAAGYVTPLALDDGTGPHGIDNPEATPYPAASKRKHRTADTAAEVEMLLGTDSAEGIAKRLGYSTVDVLAITLGRTDKALADRLREAQIIRRIA